MIYKQYLFKDRLPLMNRALDAYALRQRTISNNIANATTPDYRPEKVKFEEEFHNPQLSMKGLRSEDNQIPMGAKNPGDVEGEVEFANVPRPEAYFSGETHVNIDKEMSELAQNQIRYRLGSRMTQRYFQGLQNSIRGAAQ